MSRSAIARLDAISRKEKRRIIGLMSGTSLDGLDVAVCDITGAGEASRVSLAHFATVPYPEPVKSAIREVFAKPVIDFQQLCLLNPWIGKLHAQYVLKCLGDWGIAPAGVDLIASHGQTVFHAPRTLHQREGFPNATLQMGDGDHLAVDTGIITISDFRQKHCAAGGEGAPLALYGDYLLFSRPGEARLMLNMGGIANFTFLPGSTDPSAVYVTDTGPGNTLIDAAARRYFHQAYDKDSLLARQGRVNDRLLETLKADPFFCQDFPRTTGPELFSLGFLADAQKSSGTEDIDPHDLLATLTRLSADTIADAIRTVWLPGMSDGVVYASGGGAHNPLLMKWIREALRWVTLKTTDALGLPGDAKEAVLFAVLANETVAGEPLYFGKARMPAITMGKISFP